MRGRLWLNLGLALLVAVLAAVAWFQPGKTPPPPQIRLANLDPQTVRRIDFHPPRGAAFALVRDGEDWFIEQPRLRAQPFRVETLLELPGATSAAQFTLADNKDNAFGVDPPQARVRFDDTEIAFGLTNPVGLRRYVRVGDAVHLIDDRFYHHAASNWVAWVDRRVLPEGVTLSALDLPGLRLRREGTAWQIDPPRAQASADAVTALIEEWQRAYAMDVEETTAVPADAQTLRLQWQDAALELAVAQEGDEWLLYRRDAPLRYRFSANQGKRLLELQESVPADGAPPAAAPPTGEPAAEAPAAP
jgi:hypothetical protein